MKGFYSVALAIACTASAVATPVNFDFSARAQHDSEIVSRSVDSDGAAFAQNKFTHLVVGGGTAGVAVAVRLSEVKSNLVGLIEAGVDGDDDPRNYIPGQFGANLGTIYDWNYTAEASSAGAPAIGWPRGKVLGGSSVLNFLVWDRATEIEYDAWESLGNKGWNWKNMYKYMKKAETFSAPSKKTQKLYDIDVNSDNYGSSGPVGVSFPKYVSNQVQKWIPALESLGIEKNDEPLGGNNIGASVQPSDILKSNSTRSSSNFAYLAPASGRSNLKVLVSALATKVNFKDGKGTLTANGVTYTSGGQSYTASASKKVVISGGTVNTPALLELSGIGSPSILKSAGVSQKIDNSNVGENLQDHVYTSLAYELVPGTTTLDSLRNNATYAAEQLDLWKQNKKSIFDETVPSIGYLTLKQLVGEGNTKALVDKATAYVKTQKDKPYYNTLKTQLTYLQKYPDGVSQMEVIGVDGFFATNGAPAAGSNYVTFLAAQQHLLSRGTVHITSSDPAAKPIIQPNYFTASTDLDILTAGTSFLRKIAAASPYQKNFITKETVPGSSVTDLRTYSQNTFTTEYHPIGTASMLPRNKGGVVDSNLIVYGTTNLHVVDASVIPVHVSAHIQATIYGVAEAAADIIKGKSLS